MLAAVLCGCKSEASVEAVDEVKKDKVVEDATIYTSEDIYIYSFECGYLSEHRNLRDNMIMVETDEQLTYAQQNYGLGEDYVHSEFCNLYVEEFGEMKKEYPIEEYTYLLCYDEVASGGYYLHADKVQILDNRIGFLMDDESYSPGQYDMVSEVMGGFFHMAAIPKDYLEGMTFENVVYPSDVND